MLEAVLDHDRSSRRLGSSTGDILVDQVETFALISRPRVSDILTLKEMFYALVAKASPSHLRRLAKAASQNHYVPRQIILHIAMQPVDIATPVLLCSPVLKPVDLVAILDKCDDSHAYIIARRHDLDKQVVDRLLSKTMAPERMRELLEQNPTACVHLGKQPLARAGRLQVMEPLAGAAPVREKREAQRSRNDDLLKLARLTPEFKHRKKAASRKPPYKPAVFGQRLVELLRNRDHGGFAREIETICKLNSATVSQYLAEQNAGTIASILFLLSVPRYTAARVLLLACPKVGRDHSVFVRIMDAFSQLERTAAINYFKQIDANFSVPVQQHHIIEAQPVITGLRRRKERLAREAETSPAAQTGLRKAG